MNNNNSFILASASPRRKLLLTQARYNFTIISPNIKETNNPKENAFNKALTVAKNNYNKIILACDTIVVCDSKVLNKPDNFNTAFTMLKTLNKNKHAVYTSFCILIYNDKVKKIIQKTVKSIVYFGNFSDEFLKAYINTKEPMDKAGAYGIQEIGSVLVKKIHGSYTNVVGLPMYEVANALQKFNITALI